jgi:ubiquinone biosynthesis protein UbiJ
MFAQSAIAALNHLLVQNSWALPRLTRFAGKTVRFDVAPFSFSCSVSADGRVCTADAQAVADALCRIAPSLLPRLAIHDEQAYAEIYNEGDQALLAEIFFLSRNLRWDAAEDLSRITGDIAAERIVQGVQTVQQQLGGAVANIAHAAAEYWTEESPLVAKPEQLREFARQVDTLRDDISRLAQRVQRIQDRN